MSYLSVPEAHLLLGDLIFALDGITKGGQRVVHIAGQAFEFGRSCSSPAQWPERPSCWMSARLWRGASAHARSCIVSSVEGKARASAGELADLASLLPVHWN